MSKKLFMNIRIDSHGTFEFECQEQSVEELLIANRFDWYRKEINSANFPQAQEFIHKKKMTAELISFREEIFLEMVYPWLADTFHLARIVELLSFIWAVKNKKCRQLPFDVNTIIGASRSDGYKSPRGSRYVFPVYIQAGAAKHLYLIDYSKSISLPEYSGTICRGDYLLIIHNHAGKPWRQCVLPSQKK